MLLIVQIKKTRTGLSTLTVERPDGTKTYSKLNLGFEIHDIAHYVVEKQLRLQNSFYGMLSQGYQIEDFQLPKKNRPEALQPKNIPREALATEHLVNLLTIDFMSDESQMNILESLSNILKENNLPLPHELNVEKLTSIKKELADWMLKWNALESGKILKMNLIHLKKPFDSA